MKNITRKIAVFVLVAMTAMVILPLHATVGNAAGEPRTAGHANIAGSKNYAQFIKMVIECIQTGLQTHQFIEIADERTPLSGPEQTGEGDVPQIVEEQGYVEEAQEVVETAAFEAPVQNEPSPSVVEPPAQPTEPETVLPPEQSQTQENGAGQIITLMPTEEHDVSGILNEEPLPTETSALETQEVTGNVTNEPTLAEPTEPVIEHTVIYVDQDDLFMRTLLVEDGDTLQTPQSIPELEGHTFLYWYELELGPVPYEFGMPVYRNMILKPLFEEVEIATLPETPEGNSSVADDAEPDVDTVTVVDDPPKSDHEVVGIIKGDDGLEILIVKDPTEIDLTVVTDDETSQDPVSTLEDDQSLEPTETTDNPTAVETEDVSTDETDDVSVDPTTETETETSEEPTSEDTSTDEPTTEDGSISEEDPVTTEEGDGPTLEPTVELVFDYVSEDENGLLVEGSIITVTAVLSNFPEGEQLKYQWQNNADGEFADVPGATELSYSFVADEYNTGCSWRIKVTVVEPGESVVP